jgi:hypothetical protein
VGVNSAFYILKILENYSDEDNKLKKKDILDLLYTEYEITMEEKQFYRKIKELEALHYNIVKVTGRYSTYYLKKSSLKYADYIFQAAMIKGNNHYTKQQTIQYVSEYLEQSAITIEKEESIYKLIMNINEPKSNRNLSNNLEIIVRAIHKNKEIQYKLGKLTGEKYSFSDVYATCPQGINILNNKLTIVCDDEKNRKEIPLDSMFNIEIIEKF